MSDIHCEVFLSLNKNGELLKVSQSWLECYGYDRTEVIGAHFTNFLSTESHTSMAEHFSKLKEYGKIHKLKLSIKHKNGSYTDIILNGVSHYDKEGNITHTDCEINTLENLLESNKKLQELLEKTDHSNEELLRTQKELLKEKTLLSMAQEVVGLGCWSIDSQTKKVYWSDEIYTICGLEVNSIVPSYRTYLNIVHPEDKKNVNNAFTQAIEHNSSFDISHRCILPDNSILYIRQRGKNLQDAQGNNIALMGTFLDITESVLIQKQLLREKQKAELASESKAQFLANMSHEIRTPMNAILGFVDILDKQENDSNKKEQFGIIKSSGKALLHIIDDILDFSKLQHKKLHLEKIAFNPKESFKNSIMLYTGLAKDKKINFNYTISPQLPNRCLGDEIRLKQVLSNLISNAIKFTPEGGYIQVNTNYTQGRVYISVEDSGVGIQADKLEHIFNMFEQEDASVTRSFGGTGLGLAISKELVEMMGGELLVRSHVGYGSYFNFNIVLEPVAEDENEEETVAIQKDEPPLQGRILLVEDNKSNQLLMGIFLEELGLDYDIANDGVEAVDMLKESTYKDKYYKAILMDENMPNMNGIQACKEIRSFEKQRQNKSLIIAVTANALHHDKERFLKEGMDDYLSKPLDQKKLEQMLRKYL